MNFIEFMAIQGQAKRDLKLLPEQWLQVLAPHLDSSGGFQNLLDSSGEVTEVSGSAIATSTARLQEALADRVITVTEVEIVSDGAGAYTGDLLAAPAAGYHMVIMGLRLNGVNLTGGTLNIATDPASVLLTDRCASGRSTAPIQAPLATATALSATGSGLGAATKYWVEIMWATEAD